MADIIKNYHIVLEYGEVYKNLVADFSGYTSNTVAQGVTWASSNTSVVAIGSTTISSTYAYANLIAGNVDGTSTITATLVANPNVKRTCQVDVMKNVVRVNGVKLDGTKTVHMNVNQTHIVHAEIQPSNASNQSVIWDTNVGSAISLRPSPENPNTCYVDSIKHGTGTLFVTTIDGGYMATASFIVDDSILVSRIAITPSVLNLEMGQTAKLTATISPSNATNKNVIWSVPSGAITHVSQDGTVTPVKIGTSRIIAESADGNASAWITVNVSKSTAPATGIRISGYSRRLIQGKNETVYARAIPSDEYYDGELEWSSDNPSFVTVTKDSKKQYKAQLKAIAHGVATITASSPKGKLIAKQEVQVVSSGRFNGYTMPVAFVAPENIEVRRGQVFAVRVTALGGDYTKDIFGETGLTATSYRFTTSSQRLEVYYKSADTDQIIAWFKAPDTIGNYTITVAPSSSLQDKNFPTRTINVKVIDSLYDSYIDYVNVSKYYIMFAHGDYTSSHKIISKSPCSIQLLKMPVGKDKYEPFAADEYKDLEWDVLKSGIVGNIEVSGDKIKIYEGANYGIAQVIFRFKSRPYLYFPVWVINVGGSYKYYKSDVDDGSSAPDAVNKIGGVELSRYSITLNKEDELTITATIHDTYGSDSAGVICTKVGGVASAEVVDITESSEDTVRTIRVRAISSGTAQYRIASITDPTRYATLNISIRSDGSGGDGGDDEGYVKPEYIPKTNGVDTIVRVDYNESGTFTMETLYSGNLNFDLEHPIESVVYHETDNIQKIYWVDGKNVLRSMNFVADDDEKARWEGDYMAFDSNKGTDFALKAEIEKDYAGNTRPNGVIQYILTYYNEHGQESGPVWTSDLVYLSPSGTGGPADATNTCRITISLKHLDTSFTNYRVYSLFRTSEDGTATSYIVSEGSTSSSLVVVDDFANQTGQDASRLLYLGSQAVKASTITHKDQTLFLGDITGTGRGSLYDDLENAISEMYDSSTGLCNYGVITFEYSDGPKLPDSDELYPYENQLQYTSSEILTFKGGEKYRFALMFKFADGTSTDAFWIGDAENILYPKMEGDRIQRVVAKCKIPFSVFEVINKPEYTDHMGAPLIRGVQLMIAEATYADRSVKAQGILNPTVFNVWERYNNRLYAQASWISRPRNSGFACRHFEPIHNSNHSTGEIDCNYWDIGSPTPYFQVTNYNETDKIKYVEEFDGIPKWDYLMVIYGIECIVSFGKRYSPYVLVVKAKKTDEEGSASEIETLDFSSVISAEMMLAIMFNGYYVLSSPYYTIEMYYGSANNIDVDDAGRSNAYSFSRDFIINNAGLTDLEVVPEDVYKNTWCNAAWSRYKLFNPGVACFNAQKGSTTYDSFLDALDDKTSGTKHCSKERWVDVGGAIGSESVYYRPSYYKKHLMFVDENVITLNSPEIENNAVSFDNAEGHSLRIVGVAKVTGLQSDYTVDAEPGKYPGENLINDAFSATKKSGNLDGLTSWPLWIEYGLDPKDPDTIPELINRTSADYNWGPEKNNYWLHMWNHTGKINAYTDEDNNAYSTLNSKIFANLRVCASTIYRSPDRINSCNYELSKSSLRVFNYISGQYVGIDVGGEKKYYDANIKTSLSTPGEHKYPAYFSNGRADTANHATAYGYDLMLASPVMITYRSTPHAVITLPSTYDEESKYFYQTTLPDFIGKDDDRELVPDIPMRNESVYESGAILPWVKEKEEDAASYPYLDYIKDPSQPVFDMDTSEISKGDKYIFIGEIYHDYNKDRLLGKEDMRYGGIERSAIQNNKFIVAGPLYRIEDFEASREIIADRGDTYFQRWDCLKTKPYKGSVNGVIDITSVMLETHINIDGRTDQQRGVSQLASIDYENFGVLNNVYSQKDRYNQRRDLDEDFNLDAYRSTITWTLQKNDLADIDEWMHVTLASTLKLDGDRGILRAIRRMQNNIIAFQDKGISEILFNSRTQLSTTDGVPVEIANSGKVDGKRYITNKYGCINKWSIVEGKTGLYFIDNINKAFCLFSGNGVDSLSDKLGFGIWFKDINNTKPWAPADFKNVVSFYDREHSDIYLVKDSDDEMPCLVYNENLQAFTSFFDYSGVPMITNVRDRLVSFKDNKLWLQNEGLYCNFFGEQYDFWVQYRVTPDPFSDKIWTNFDYRADFYHLLDKDATPALPEEYLINGDRYGDSVDIYKENETFTCYKVWDEYQTTGAINLRQDCCMIDPVRKKFRIWRVAIARAMRDKVNIHGLDRIRNPWINLLLKKHVDEKCNQYLMQLHDIVVKYFE